MAVDVPDFIPGSLNVQTHPWYQKQYHVKLPPWAETKQYFHALAPFASGMVIPPALKLYALEFYDDFDGIGSAVDIAGRALITGGTTWVKHTGGSGLIQGVALQGGTVRKTGGTDGWNKYGPTLALSSTTLQWAQSDVTLKSVLSNIGAGVFAYSNNSATHNSFALDWDGTQIRIARYTAGVQTFIGSAFAYAPPTGVTVSLRLVCTPSLQRGYLNGVLVVQTTDAQAAGGGLVGLWSRTTASQTQGDTTGCHWRNFRGGVLPAGV